MTWRLLAVLLLCAAGCGDSSGLALDAVGSLGDAAPEIDAGPKGDGWRLESAKLLALREQPGLYLDEERAEVIDSLLARAKEVAIDAEGVALEHIFARPVYYMDQMYLQSYDEEMQAGWESGMIETGDPALDLLLQSLEPSRIEPAAFGSVTLWFARWVDIEALEARFAEFGFLYSSPVCHCIDGDDIELTDGEAEARFRFHRKWGDCFVGCWGDHWWDVLVPHDPDLPAELVDEGGSPLPPP
jgi:hypothetical protein